MRYKNARMNEIISLHGQPFHSEPEQRPRRSLISFKRVGKALLLVIGSLALVALAGWLVYATLLVERRAREGDAEARYRLGKRALAKAVSVQERTQALQWIQMAADQGYMDAETALGFLYARQNNSPQDSELATKWFIKAAIQGDVAAQNELAAMYASGKGVSRDLQKAICWYTRAAAQGSRLAQANLALAQAAGSHSLGELTTRKGQRYNNVALRNIESDGIMIAYESVQGGVGLVKLKRDELPDNLQQLCKYSSKTNSPGSRPAPWL